MCYCVIRAQWMWSKLQSINRFCCRQPFRLFAWHAQTNHPRIARTLCDFDIIYLKTWIPFCEFTRRFRKKKSDTQSKRFDFVNFLTVSTHLHFIFARISLCFVVYVRGFPSAVVVPLKISGWIILISLCVLLLSFQRQLFFGFFHLDCGSDWRFFCDNSGARYLRLPNNVRTVTGNAAHSNFTNFNIPKCTNIGIGFVWTFGRLRITDSIHIRRTHHTIIRISLFLLHSRQWIVERGK